MKLRTALLSLIAVSSISTAQADKYELHNLKEYTYPVKVHNQLQFDTIFNLLERYERTYRNLFKKVVKNELEILDNPEIQEAFCGYIAIQLSKYEFVMTNSHYIKPESDYIWESYFKTLETEAGKMYCKNDVIVIGQN